MKNEIRLILGDTAVMELTQGKLCMVDVADLEMLGAHRWSYAGSHSRYAATYKEGKTILMHRFIMGFSGTYTKVDHVSRDRLDNRRGNLRRATNMQNQGNRAKNSNNTSGFKGVYSHRDTGKWLARLTKGKKKMYLGIYDNRESAARAYDSAASGYFGEFAMLNFPTNPIDYPHAQA